MAYYRYRAIEFLTDPELKGIYKGGNIDPDRFSQQLARIMQMNLVKRLESSFTAFKVSLGNLRQYTQNMIDMWEANSIFICPDINVNAELDKEKRLEKEGRLCTFEECVEDLRRKINRVYVYNFMPSAQGNAQIQLVQKAYTKLQSFHTLFGEDSQIYTEDEEVMHYDLNS